MIVKSFVRDGLGLRPIEMEISLVPGLPQIRFLGLPDTLIRESEIRIKAAIRAQGFLFPKAQQIMVQMRPLELKKHSQGLDLAVAAGYLWLTGQVKKPEQTVPIYGELEFTGKVRLPSDWEDLASVVNEAGVICGGGESSPFGRYECGDLRGLENLVWGPPSGGVADLVAPQMGGFLVTETQARILAIIGVGEHQALLCGPPGSGKSTMAEAVPMLLGRPQPDDFFAARQVARSFGEDLRWRSIRRPHHTVTTLAMVGGGSPPNPGEITRAHGGTLILDEFLEFAPEVQEALREPLENGRILISRTSGAMEFPARFLLVATTNLCQCGYLIPEKNHECRCRNSKKMVYLERLSGPMLDRFHLIAFSSEWGSQFAVPLSKVRDRVWKAIEFRKESRQQNIPNGWLAEEEIERRLEASVVRALREMVLSSRRRKSLLQMARTIADLDGRASIQGKDLQEAFSLGAMADRRLKVDVR